MPALRAEGVSAGYGRAPIINDITVTADLGSVTTIIGPNGAGKSTFAKTLVGILKPMSGTDRRQRRRHHHDARATRSRGTASSTCRRTTTSSSD